MPDERARLAAALAGRYDVERALGSGGMATVYLAKDLRHDRQVAIKVLRSDLAASLGADRFLREIRIAANITHPHVLPVHDSGEADGFLYYVMPYIEGESLRARIDREGELPVADAARILRDVADALAAAHDRDIVHRDVKPDNVLLAGRHALVADFGVAKAVSEATGRHDVTTAGVALGTPHYMAPEQASADPQIDRRVDVYALGALAYEMVTGKPPFAGEAAHQILTAHLTRPPAPVTDRRPNLPPELADLIMRCLEKKPADRWQTAAELVPKLDAMASSTAGMTPAGTRAVPAPTRRSGRTWMLGGLAGLVLLVIAVVVSSMFGPSSVPAVELGQRAQVTREAALEIDPALSPDGSLLAYSARANDGAFKVFVRQVEGGTPIPVAPDLAGGQRFPAWSPDGERLAFSSDRGLEIVPALGGVARTLIPGPTAGGSWNPDGSAVAVIRFTDLVVAPASGGDVRTLVENEDIHSPAWSPDGRWIAYVAGNRTGVATIGNIAPSEIRIVGAEGAQDGDARAVTDSTAFNASPTWLGMTLLFVSDRDGGRDVYAADIDGDGAAGEPPRRITTGLDALSVEASADGTRLSYSAFSDRSNIWSMPVPDEGPVSAATASPLTSGAQIIEIFDVSRDGQWLVFDSNRSGNQDVYRQPTAGGPIEQLTTDPGDDFAPALSPDGTELAFYSYRDEVPRQLLLMPAGGGAVTRPIAEPAEATGPRWSPDGSSLVVRIWPGTLAVIRRANGGWQTPVSLADGVFASFFEWSPDGRSIAYSAAEGLGVVTVADGVSRIIYAEPDTDTDSGQFHPQWSADGSFVYFLQQAGIYRIPADGGTPVMLVQFDPARPWHRYGFRAVGGRFYFTLGELDSDIWVADVLK